MDTSIQTQDWYNLLVDDCKSIITESVFASRWALVEGYWQLGQRIDADIKSQPINKTQLFQDLGKSVSKCSKSTFYYSHQLFSKYPDISTLPEGKNITWNKLITKYLPEFSDEEKKRIEHKQLPDDIQLVNDDFRTYEIPDNSVDAIITDPPYPQEFLSLWDDLSDFAARVLKPSGFLVAYSGQYHLPEVFRRLSLRLEYVWTISLEMKGSTQLVNARNIMCAWKPILIYCKPPFVKKPFYDVISSPQGEKELHEWQQSECGVKKLIEYFTNEGDTVVDPFSGAGTFAKVAFEMKRKSLGIEIDKNTHLRAVNRI